MASFWGLPTSKDTSEGRWLHCGRATFAGSSAMRYGVVESWRGALEASLMVSDLSPLVCVAKENLSFELGCVFGGAFSARLDHG